MIVALVLVALVASAQALPGSDPVSEALAVLSQDSSELATYADAFGLQSMGSTTLCLVGKIVEITKAVNDVRKESGKVVTAVHLFNEKLVACMKDVSADKFVCICQSMRDVWEDSANDRVEMKKVVDAVAKTVYDVSECFKDESS